MNFSTGANAHVDDAAKDRLNLVGGPMDAPLGMQQVAVPLLDPIDGVLLGLVLAVGRVGDQVVSQPEPLHKRIGVHRSIPGPMRHPGRDRISEKFVETPVGPELWVIRTDEGGRFGIDVLLELCDFTLRKVHGQNLGRAAGIGQVAKNRQLPNQRQAADAWNALQDQLAIDRPHHPHHEPARNRLGEVLATKALLGELASFAIVASFVISASKRLDPHKDFQACAVYCSSILRRTGSSLPVSVPCSIDNGGMIANCRTFSNTRPSD